MGGRFVAADGNLQSVSPSDTDHVVGIFADASPAVDEAVELAGRAQRRWRRLPLADRIAVLHTFADRLAQNESEFARAIATEVGKPWSEALAEAALLPRKIRLTCTIATRELPPVVPDLTDGYWDYRPLGVIAVLGPFNFPVHLSNGHIAPALVAGNAVILKPSEHAPACAELYAECWEAAAGEYADALSVLPGGPRCGEALVVHPDIDGVCFTGSWDVGVRIRELTVAQTSKLLALEMGGKNAAVVLADADLTLAVAECTNAALWSCGQRCTATSRVLVDPRIYEEFADRLVASVRQWMPPTSPLDESCRLGPLSTAGGFERFVARQGTDHLGGLSTLLSGGPATGPGTPGYWVHPAIHAVEDAAVSVGRWSEELFGPEVLLEAVDGLSAMVERANATPYGLAASVFTRDRESFEHLRREIEAGVINWNCGTAGASGAMPFGGVKRSGNHRPAGSHSLRYCVTPVATLYR